MNNSIARKRISTDSNSSNEYTPSRKKKRLSSKNQIDINTCAESVKLTSNETPETNEDLDKNFELIKDLVEKQKKVLFSDKYEDNCSDSDQFESLLKELVTDKTITSIKKLRKLPNYKEIGEILNAPKKSTHTKLKTASLNSITWHKTETQEHWSTYTYLSEKIEQCVLNKKWDYLTKLLKLFTDSPKWYRPFLLRSTIINLICNPISKDDESILEEFLKSGFSCQSEEDMRQTLTDIFHIPATTEEEPIE